MATMTATGYYDERNNLLRFTVTVSDLQSDYTGSRQIVFELTNTTIVHFIEIETRSISGDGTYNFSTKNFGKGYTYVGNFKLQYKNEGAESWSTALTETSNGIGVPPDKFEFPSSIRSGAATTTLKASTWNSFCNRINAFETYKGNNQTRFTDVEPGDEMTASIIQEAWNAINKISGHGSMPTRPTKGATIYASFFHELANALNNID